MRKNNTILGIAGLLLLLASCTHDDDLNFALGDVYYHAEVNASNDTVFSISASTIAPEALSSAYFFPQSDSTDRVELERYEASNQSFLYREALSNYTEEVPSSEPYSFEIMMASGVQLAGENDLPSANSAISPTAFKDVSLSEGILSLEWSEVNNADGYVVSLEKNGNIIAQNPIIEGLNSTIQKPNSGWRLGESVESGESIQVSVLAVRYEAGSTDFFDSQAIRRETIVWE